MPNITKNAQGYGYKYTDLAAINDYIESIGETYVQSVSVISGNDYIVTTRFKEGKEALQIRGCRVVQATLTGKNNPAQEQGSGLTYARRYSLLMAYGLATEDDDGESLTQKGAAKKTFKPATDKTATDTQKGFIANLLRQRGVENDDMKEWLADKYGVIGDMSQADAQMIIDDMKEAA